MTEILKTSNPSIELTTSPSNAIPLKGWNSWTFYTLHKNDIGLEELQKEHTTHSYPKPE